MAAGSSWAMRFTMPTTRKTTIGRTEVYSSLGGGFGLLRESKSFIACWLSRAFEPPHWTAKFAATTTPTTTINAGQMSVDPDRIHTAIAMHMSRRTVETNHFIFIFASRNLSLGVARRHRRKMVKTIRPIEAAAKT
ncbi:hypothetical protein ARTHRO9V_230079 [Arthrobacter sp. 9V]|nr:hypothetical protein ARTHRO9V_230079 [Arthrobacter sp. 9V]